MSCNILHIILKRNSTLKNNLLLSLIDFFQIINGPIIPIRLKANVTMPDMEISEDTLDFSDVNCGECKVITVQLYNSQHVKCEWNSNPTEKDRKVNI